MREARCAVGTTESFKVKVGLHQESVLRPFLFAVIMDRLTDEIRREPPWTMLFADDIVICEETKEEVEQRLESWKYALERRGMKVSRSKTEYLCINGRNDDETVKMEDAKVPRVKEFKYLGSTVQESGGCEREVKEESTGRMERMEKSIGSNLRQEVTSWSKRKSVQFSGKTCNGVWT